MNRGNPTDFTAKNNRNPRESMRPIGDFSQIEKTHAEATKEISHYHAQSLPPQRISTNYGALPPPTPRTRVTVPEAHSVPTRSWEERFYLPQTKITSSIPAKDSARHSFRPPPPNLGSSTQPVQRPTSLQAVTAQASTLSGKPVIPNLGVFQYPENFSTNHTLGSCPCFGQETYFPQQRKSVLPSARTTSTTPQKRALPFPGPDRWKQAREYRRKVYQLPQVDPRTDLSIVRVEADADVWVSQLVDAMKNTDDVKDLQNSHHRRLFLPKKTDDLLIDACCCAIFEALIDRCRYGFRGPAQFNKALKPMHGLELDRTATCEVRIRNVVRVLRWNKRVCKDVLYEDWKIRLLVNHPLSYDKEKDNQKGSNDQRRKRQLEQVEKLKETEEKMKETEKKLKDFEDTNDPARNKDVDDACVAGFPVNGTSDVNDMLAEDMLMHETPNTYADLHGANNFDHSDFSLGKRAASSSLDANERKRQCQ